MTPTEPPEAMDRPSPLAFVKLEGLGNDFMLIDGRHGAPKLSPDAIRRLGDRRLGVGFDQLLCIHSPRAGHAFDVAIHNADGSPAEQCGNGMRTLAAWLDARDELPAEGLDIGTPAGRVRLVRADALDGAPAWSAELPGLELGAGDATRRDVRLGNPHRVLRVDQPPDPERLEDARRAQPLQQRQHLGGVPARPEHHTEGGAAWWQGGGGRRRPRPTRGPPCSPSATPSRRPSAPWWPCARPAPS